jgi:hypothetical protein
VSDNVIHEVISNKKPKQTNLDDALIEFAEVLEVINENKASAELNEISMIDNMGRRIYY